MRVLGFTAGCVALLLAWCGAFEHVASGAFSAHMLAHMTVVVVASPLMAFAISGTRFDPVVQAPRVFSPLLASLAELVVVWAWHTPRLHRFAREVPVGSMLEQGMFLGCGLWLWIAAFGGGSRARGERGAQGAVSLLLTCMHMTLLGALIALPQRTLFGHAGHCHECVLSPLEDQQLGGAIMILAGGMAYMVGGLALVIELLRGPATREVA